MMFTVAREVFELFPDYLVAVAIAENIDNSQYMETVNLWLAEQCRELQGQFTTQSLKEHPPIAVWRRAFEKLNVNPNKYPSSIEAMLKRAVKGKQLPSISPIVDLCNSLSLKHCVPIGTHDIDSWQDECLSVRFSTPADKFLPFGATQFEPVDSGEIVYASGSDVRTRRWVWRQSETARITPATTRVLIPIDGFSATRQAVLAAQQELASLLRSAFNVPVATGLISQHHNEFKWHNRLLSHEVLGCPVEESD